MKRVKAPTTLIVVHDKWKHPCTHTGVFPLINPPCVGVYVRAVQTQHLLHLLPTYILIIFISFVTSRNSQHNPTPTSTWGREVKTSGSVYMTDGLEILDCTTSSSSSSPIYIIMGTLIHFGAGGYLKALTFAFTPSCCWVWLFAFCFTGESYIRW